MPVEKRVNTNFFKSWSSDMAYVLGFFAADGCMIKNSRNAYFIEFHITDRDLLINIRKALNSDHKISIKKGKHNEKDGYRLQIGSKEIFDDLSKLGFTERKSKKMIMPSVPEKYISHFVRGYFDGDGNVYANKYQRKGRCGKSLALLVGFTCGSRCFLDKLRKRLAGSANLKGGSLCKRESYFRLHYSVNDSCKLYRFMYNFKGGMFLKRKKVVFEKYFRKAGVVF